jgi:hypothetical protein
MEERDMLTLLAFVGLIFILWYISKGLKRFGTWLEAIAEQMTDRSVSNTRTKQNSEEAQANIKKVRETLNKIKSEHPDDEYISKVRDEINRLT